MSTRYSCFILVGPENKDRIADSVAGLAPRLDYRLVAEQLDATVVECAPPPTAFRGHKAGRILRSLAGNFRAALSVTRQLPNRSIVYSTGETWGLPMALVSALSPRRQFIHVIYVHRVFSPAWLRFLRATRNWLAVDGWICVTQQQARHLRAALGSNGAPIAVISQGVDNRFFAPERAAVYQKPPYILSVGVEMRDYRLLFEAVRSLDIDVIVKASSAWMAVGRDKLTAIPTNVQIITQPLSYVELRDLYANAALVVIPVIETLQAAGITTILEAMAMSKCVIATRSSGLPDILVHNQTGIIVQPDADALTDAITALMAAPQRRAALGYTGQQVVSTSTSVVEHARQVADFLRLLQEKSNHR